MAKVLILPSEVAERIAAGEVIERPSSVIKELVENSIDAGATEISVALENGGKSLIEVLDNGRGMQRDDLALSIQRHATSKLRTLDDLERLVTLGFRGEALPSIAAVSELSLVSRAEGTDSAYELSKGSSGTFSAPKALTFGHFLGSPHGTRIRAESLFAQVPARLKFLRSESSEVSQVRDWLERLALAHPEISFRLTSHDRPILQLKRATEEERVRQILAEGEAFPVRYAEAIHEDLKIRAYWFEGLTLPHTRKLAQVVNSRSIRDRLIQQAILGPFRQALLPGRFPAVALFLEVNPSTIDVNVHPTKSEVRFLDQSRVFRSIQSLLEKTLESHGSPVWVPGPKASESAANEIRYDAPVPNWSLREQPSLSFGTAERASENLEPDAEPDDAPIAENSALWALLSESRFAGTLFLTYLLFDQGHELVLIDQHAADERIRYEKLKRQVFAKGGFPPTQPLLLPETVPFASERRGDLELRLSWLERLGFGAEVFGEGTVLFREVPAAWGTSSLGPRLKSLVERALEIDTEKDLAFDESLFEKLASEACHSAVRAGDRLFDAEAQSLVRSLVRCEHPWNCPHGRPTVVRIPRGKFEEWFQRRV